jgi:hypothetical protein
MRYCLVLVEEIKGFREYSRTMLHQLFPQANVLIIREYNEERPKKVQGGLTPAVYAKQLARKSIQ